MLPEATPGLYAASDFTAAHLLLSFLYLTFNHTPSIMSDPPPKKVGSLRDRIAAFENKGAAPAPAPAPIPRPKPGHVTWQPKAASPPTSPKRAETHTAGGEGAGAGMSASDAKESIGKLSLKERMAALQGQTAFGGPTAGGPPPRPSGEKPRWKPPPVVQRAAPVGEEDEEDAAKPAVEPKLMGVGSGEARSPERAEDEVKEDAKEGEDDEPKDEGEPDPEDEERQRRAALAARMARLGGARVGMGPPIFGKKPDVPPKKIQQEAKPMEEEKPKDEEHVEETVSKKEATPEVSVSSEAGGQQLYFQYNHILS